MSEWIVVGFKSNQVINKASLAAAAAAAAAYIACCC
jgi:hypothetical protein